MFGRLRKQEKNKPFAGNTVGAFLGGMVLASATYTYLNNQGSSTSWLNVLIITVFVGYMLVGLFASMSEK